jgi:CRISPR system Cascade subunit CasD
MLMNTIFLRLEGPLQAWGLRARWGERDTSDAPTKSGIIGLLGCALGYRRDDQRLRQLSDELHLGVRVDRPGTLLRDYHTTGGGRYGDTVHTGGTRFHNDPYAGGVLSAEVDSKGRIKVKINATTKEPETDTSDRYYLADASFLAVLQGPADTVACLAEALQNPVWPCFLGRKSCVPAHPILVGVGEYVGLREALASQTIPARADKPPLRLLLEVGPGAGNRQSDNIGTPARRVFRPRYVAEEWLTPGDTAPTLNTLEG